MAGRLRRRWERWLFRLGAPEPGEVLLNHRRVFVLPSQAGLGFLLLLGILFIASVNYALSLGFALTFLLAACGVVDILLAFRNLAHLHLAPGRAAPVFAGEEARFELLLINRRRHPRYALWLGFVETGDTAGKAGGERLPPQHAADVPAQGSQSVTLTAPTFERGWRAAPRVRLQTRYPLGLVRAWSYWRPQLAALVYPRPEDDAPPLPMTGSPQDGGYGGGGTEDFAGVRGYRAGDPLKHLAWRQIARLDPALGGTLVTKQFDGGGSSELCLDFAELPPTLELELKLARLTRWVLEADARGAPYAFRLGITDYPAARGAAHRDACLRALALYEDGR